MSYQDNSVAIQCYYFSIFSKIIPMRRHSGELFKSILPKSKSVNTKIHY